MESPLILMYFHSIFLWPLGDQRALTRLWDVCPALAKMHTLPTCTRARTHAHKHGREIWRGNWSATWSWEGIPMGLIKGTEQTAELIWDTTLSPTLLSPSCSYFLFCSSVFRLMKATSSRVGGIQRCFLAAIHTPGYDQRSIRIREFILLQDIPAVCWTACNYNVESYYSVNC